MSGLTNPAVGAAAAVLGTRIVADHAGGLMGEVAKGASGLLPFTGIAVGIYALLGIGLIVGGLLLRRFGKDV